MSITACQQGKTITEVHQGKCDQNGQSTTSAPTSDPPKNTLSCDTVKCRAGATCKMVNNKPQCVCANLCPRLFVAEPICGSDGKDYG